jgi:hypothetical protein
VACCETDQNELALQVIRGSVEIDPLSPSERRGNKKQHPQQRQRRQFDEEDYDEDLYGRGGGGRGGGDDGGVGRQTHNRGMGRDRERESDRDDYGHTNDSNKNYRGRDGPPPRFAARGNRDTSADDMPADVRDRDRDGDRTQGRGAFHEDRDLRNPGLQVSSPKKFMSSLRDMNGGNSEERTAKLKKDQEYQAQLRQQIEEKNRKKEIEKQKEDEIKRQNWYNSRRLWREIPRIKGLGPGSRPTTATATITTRVTATLADAGRTTVTTLLVADAVRRRSTLTTRSAAAETELEATIAATFNENQAMMTMIMTVMVVGTTPPIGAV